MRQHLRQPAPRRRRELRQLQAGGPGGLREQRARAARLQRRGDAGCAQLPLLREQQGRLEHRHRVLDQDHALRAEPCVAQRGVAGQRPRVRHDRAAGRLAPALGRADQHGLAGAAQRIESATDTLDVAHRLDVARDDLRLRVGGRPLEHVTEPEHGLVADAEDDPQPHSPVRGQLVHRPGHGAALADHADRAGKRLRRRGRAVGRDAVDVVHEALDVGPEHRDAGAQRGLAELRLQSGALLARLGEPRRDHHDAPHAAGAAVVDHANDHAGGHDEHHEIDAARKLGDRMQAPAPPHLVVLRVDRDRARPRTRHDAGTARSRAPTSRGTPTRRRPRSIEERAAA